MEDSKAQLHLLSRFSPFRGVRGIVPKSEIKLANLTGCLGTFGLLYPDDGFAVVSARLLEKALAWRMSTIRKDDLDRRFGGLAFPQSVILVRGSGALGELLIYRVLHRSYRYLLSATDLLSTCCFPYSPNTINFIHSYLNFLVGEPVYSAEPFQYNVPLLSFTESLVRSLSSIGKSDSEVTKFVDDFTKYPYYTGGEGGPHTEFFI